MTKEEKTLYKKKWRESRIKADPDYQRRQALYMKKWRENKLKEDPDYFINQRNPETTKRSNEAYRARTDPAVIRAQAEKQYHQNPKVFLARSIARNKGWETATSSRKPWTIGDLHYVLRTMGQPIKEVADKLNRSYVSIAAKRTILKDL